MENDGKLRQKIYLGTKEVTLIYNSFPSDLDVDALFSIDYANLYGEKVTMPTLIQKVNNLKAYAEEKKEMAEFDCERISAEIKKRYRVEALINQGKFEIVINGKRDKIKLTEDSLKEAVLIDPKYVEAKKKAIRLKKDYETMVGLVRAAAAKNKNLETIMKPVTPEDLYHELVEGAINGIIINKNGNKLLKTK